MQYNCASSQIGDIIMKDTLKMEVEELKVQFNCNVPAEGTWGSYYCWTEMLRALQQFWMVFDVEHWDLFFFLRASNGSSHKHRVQTKSAPPLRILSCPLAVKSSPVSHGSCFTCYNHCHCPSLRNLFFVLLSALTTAGEEKSSDCMEQGVFCNRRGSVSDHSHRPGLLSANLLAWCGTGEHIYGNAITEWQRIYTVRPQHLIIKIKLVQWSFLFLYHITPYR